MLSCMLIPGKRDGGAECRFSIEPERLASVAELMSTQEGNVLRRFHNADSTALFSGLNKAILPGGTYFSSDQVDQHFIVARRGKKTPVLLHAVFMVPDVEITFVKAN